jgi:hypothetical protein
VNSEQKEKEKVIARQMRDAGELLKEMPVLTAAFLAYKADLFDSFTKTEYTDTERRESIYTEMKVIDAVMRKVDKIISSGKRAQQILDRK